MFHNVIKYIVSLILTCAMLLSTFSVVLAAAPSNDDLENAIVIDVLPFTSIIDITDATVEFDEPQHCITSSRTAWFVFTPTASGSIRIDMTESSFNTNVSIYQAFGSGYDSLSFVGCATGGFHFSAYKDATYYIQVGTNYVGNLHFHMGEIIQFPGPMNDDFVDATNVDTVPFYEILNITEATLENGEPKSTCGLYGSLWKTVWYEYTPTTNQVISASVPAAPFAPVLAVYTGDSLSNLVELGCKVFWGEELTLSVVGGTTYYFQIGKYTSWDPDGEAQFHIEIPENLPPIAEAGNYRSVPEGSTIMLNAYKSYDPEGFPLVYEWDLDNDGEYDDATSITTNVSFGDNGYLTVGLRVTDVDGLSDTDVTKLSFFNLDPYIESIIAPTDPSQVGTLINVNGGFADSGFLDTHAATWDWGDGMISDGLVDGFDVIGSHAYNMPGVYTITLTVEDDDGGVDTAIYEYIVIYDPEGGFVTGGGWIWSPEGAYTPNPSLTGKATFGFVSKYQKGANVPDGDTEFEFNVADFHFESTSYDWLVLSGSKAQFKGVGTINSAGEYKFMVSAIDGSPDKFRIKIWDAETGVVIYDNMFDADDTVDPSTEIQGGSIVVHKAK